MRYHRHDLHGFLIVDKPLGLSSMDVVRRVRKAAGFCKAGHCGTLDPLATGVLVVCLGKGTKWVDRIMGQTKIYQATIDLSAFSATDDAEGPIQPIKPVAGFESPSMARILDVLESLTGEVEQIPPAHSAIKIGGKRAYALARSGKTVQMPPRIVTIDEIDMDSYEWPELRITVTCGKGTYIRSLARQIGSALGTGGYLTALRRLAVGDYRIERAVTLDRLPQPMQPGDLISPPADPSPA